MREDNNGNYFYDIPEIIETKRADASKQGETALPGSNPAQRPSSKERILNDILTVNDSLYQNAKGAVSFLNDGRAVLHALKNPDISTVMHELAHVWRRQLEPAEMKIAFTFYGEPNGKFSRNSEERFARAFEKYLSDGKSPSEELKGVFEKFKSWLVDIYRGIVGSPLEGQITGLVRHMFDTMLTKEGKPQDVEYRKAVAEALTEATTTQQEGGDFEW